MISEESPHQRGDALCSGLKERSARTDLLNSTGRQGPGNAPHLAARSFAVSAPARRAGRAAAQARAGARAAAAGRARRRSDGARADAHAAAARRSRKYLMPDGSQVIKVTDPNGWTYHLIEARPGEPLARPDSRATSPASVRRCGGSSSGEPSSAVSPWRADVRLHQGHRSPARRLAEGATRSARPSSSKGIAPGSRTPTTSSPRPTAATS